MNMISNVSANKMLFLQNGTECSYIQIDTTCFIFVTS